MSDQLEFWPPDVPGGHLSWSISRDRRLRDCARKYYLHHYASRGGGQANASELARQSYMLRHLRTRQMWVGTVVHEMVELALASFRRGEQVSASALVERGTRRMRAQYAESIQGVYRERPGQACGLVEHEYAEPISREEWRAQRDRMERCLRAFFSLPLVGTIRETPQSRWLAVELLATFDVEGATVFVKPDFAWRDPEGRVVIADWKTGRPRPQDDKLQLATYGLFAERAWGVGSGPLRAMAVHLDGDGGEPLATELDLTADDRAQALANVRTSLSTMRALDAAAAGEQTSHDLARFPMTAAVERCGACAFRRLCGR